MRLIRILIASAIVLVPPLLTASPASADLSGPCTATGTIKGQNYDAHQSLVVIPRKGDVKWKGAINNGGSGKRNIEGKVYINLPPPIPDLELAGSWDGPSSRYKNNGSYHYDLPSVLVGPKIVVFGHHAERGTVVCAGAVEVQLKGSKLSNPALLGSLAITVLLVLNMAFVLRAKPIRAKV